MTRVRILSMPWSQGIAGGVSLVVPGPNPPLNYTYYVSPTGSAANPGTYASPWTLAYASGGAGGLVVPGVTVGMKDGTYSGFQTFDNLTGTSGQRIVFANAAGAIPGTAVERAILDPAIEVETSCSFVDFRSAPTGWLEIANSAPVGTDRIGFFQLGSNIRFINACVHDSGQSGIFGSAQGTGGEFYGVISYNNGFNNNLDHGLYAQNTSGTKIIRDGVYFNNYAFGLHLYGSVANILIGLDVRGNTAFMNGSITGSTLHPQLLLGGGTDVQAAVVRDNVTYMGVDETSGNLWLGFESAGANHDIDAQDNWVIGGFPAVRYWRWLTNPSNFRNNRLYAPTQVLDAYGPVTTATWDTNTYYRNGAANGWVFNGAATTLAGFVAASGRGGTDTATGGAPTDGPWIRVRPNTYEPGRAHVTIYNPALASSVNVDLSTVLMVGDAYNIYNVENLFGTPATSGIYGGSSVSFPMAAVSPPVPRGSGRTTPSATGPAFQAFLVRKA